MKKSPPRRLVAFGEMLLRLSPPGFQRLTQARHLEMHFGGAEVNVLISLAQLGTPASFVSRLPANGLGDACLNQLRAFGIDTAHVARGGERLGLYFVETGASQRPSTVTYDRKGSSLCAVRAGEIDWDAAFQGAAWFHFTGITPALSPAAAAETLRAVRVAKKRGLRVSCDLNFRRKLWDAKRARRVLGSLLPHVDYCLGLEPLVEARHGADGVDPDALLEAAQALHKRFPHLRGIAVGARHEFSAARHGWRGFYYDGRKSHLSRPYELHLVERVGGGDAFTAGLLHAFLTGRTPQEAIEFAAAAGCLKHTIPGDYNLSSLEEIEALAGGTAGRRIQR